MIFHRSNNAASASTSIAKPNEDEDTECDLGYQVLAKATSSTEEDLKAALSSTTQTSTGSAINIPLLSSASAAISSSSMSSFTFPACSTTSTYSALNSLPASQLNATGTIVLPIPSLPTVQLPPQLTAKPLSGSATMPSLPSSIPAQIFPIPLPPQLSNGGIVKPPAIPSTSTSSSVGCLILEPHLYGAAENFKKELSSNPALGIFQNLTNNTQNNANSYANRTNPPLITKLRKIPSSSSSGQTAAINLSYSAQPAVSQASSVKIRKIDNNRSDLNNSNNLDVSAVLQANRDLDANTLFFLSLACSVRSMPTKFQSLAKMRCMRIVSDIELELDNVSNDCQGPGVIGNANANNNKYCSVDSPPPPDGSGVVQNTAINDGPTEHFVYVMSPSRVESMIDISSSDEDATMNGTT